MNNNFLNRMKKKLVFDYISSPSFNLSEYLFGGKWMNRTITSPNHITNIVFEKNSDCDSISYLINDNSINWTIFELFW